MQKTTRSITGFKVKEIFWGPNTYSTNPVLVISWDTGILDRNNLSQGIQPLTTYASESFARKIIHIKSTQGTTLDIVECITKLAFELLNAERGHLKSFGFCTKNDEIVSWIGFHTPEISLRALQLMTIGLSVFQNSEEKKTKFIEDVEHFLKLCHANHPDYQAKNLMMGLDSLDIPYFPVSGINRAWQYGWGKNSSIALETRLAEASMIFVRASDVKPAAKEVLKSLGMPLAKHYLANSKEDLSAAVKTVGFPCITKPIDGKNSQNTTVGIDSVKKLLLGFEVGKAFNDGSVIVEKQLSGDVYRLMVIHGRYCCTIRRTPASVIGDGASSIKQLLKKKEELRLADPLKSKYIGSVPIDDELLDTISEAGYDLETKLDKDHKLFVRKLPRLTRGADLTDVTDITCEDVRFMATSIARAMRLPIVGIDYITKDITNSPSLDCGFIEVNATPSLNIALAAGVEISSCIDAIFQGEIGRIPTTLLVLQSEDQSVFSPDSSTAVGAGWVCRGTCGIGSISLHPANRTVIECSRTVLRNPLAESIYVEIMAEELYRSGLPLDKFDKISVCADEHKDSLRMEWLEVLRKASCAPIEFVQSSPGLVP